MSVTKTEANLQNGMKLMNMQAQPPSLKIIEVNNSCHQKKPGKENE